MHTLRNNLDSSRLRTGKEVLALLLCTLGIHLAVPGSAAAQKEIPDNLTVLQALAQQAAETIMGHVRSAEEKKLLLINIYPQDEAAWLLESALLPQAYGEHIEVVQANHADDTLRTKIHLNSLIIEYKIVQAGIHYLYITHGLFRHTRVERAATLEVFAKLSKGNGQILWSEVIIRGKQDIISSSQIAQVNNNNFPFAFAELPARSGVKTLIEPLIMLGTTGTILYLFYSLRSK